MSLTRKSDIQCNTLGWGFFTTLVFLVRIVHSESERQHFVKSRQLRDACPCLNGGCEKGGCWGLGWVDRVLSGESLQVRDRGGMSITVKTNESRHDSISSQLSIVAIVNGKANAGERE